MKVLHVIPSISERSGGPGQAILPMCRALGERGVDVLLATTDHEIFPGSEFRGSSLQPTDAGPNPGSLAQNESLESQTGNSKLETRICYQDVPTIFFPVQLGESFKYSRPFAAWLDVNVKNFDVVHIHAVFNHACIAAARACRRKNVPYIVRPLGTLDPWSLNQKSLRKKVFWHAGIKKMLTSASAIQYTTKGEQEAVEESLGLNHGVVVPLGVEMRSVEEPATAKHLSEQFPTLRNHPYVLVLSRLHPKKALEVLLEAFLSLVKHAEFQDWRLVLAGEGPRDYVARLKRMAAEQLVGDFVVFPGWLNGEKKEAALRDASLLALPSNHENFGLCVMESLACGVPVLISPHVNLAADVQAAGAGWVAAVDKDVLERALAAALGSEQERLRRGEAGRNLAASFNWPAISEKLCEVYAVILAERN